MEKVPIRVLDNTNTRDKSLDGQVVALVDRILELNDARHSDRLAPSELQRIERQISGTDSGINDLVYELYGLTDEERKIIEGARR
jgi:hypothetical protein